MSNTTVNSTPAHKHPFHLVNPSPWPLFAAMSLLLLAVGAVLYMHKIDHFVFYIGLTALVVVACLWWKDVIKESDTPGIYTNKVQNGLKIGMILFIVSEIMLFATIFWGYFHSMSNPLSLPDFSWPSAGIIPFDPMHLPYLNTLILLLSGTTVTAAHYALLKQQNKTLVKALMVTVVLGLCFTVIQATEYMHAEFSLKQGIYPSNFYIATGFHGAHVIIGTIFLMVCLWRSSKGAYTPKQHVGFEAAAWYWHFVDVVWLFLFVAIYWFSYYKL